MTNGQLEALQDELIKTLVENKKIKVELFIQISQALATLELARRTK